MNDLAASDSPSLTVKRCDMDKATLPYLCLLLSLCLFGCKEEIETPSLPDLDSYLRRFEEEASARGYDFDLSEVETAYRDELEINGETYCGYGYSNYDGNGLRRIEISSADNCRWEESSDIERENFFFHEIGHAFLNRTHDESKLCDGSPLSLMTSTTNIWRVYQEAEVEKRDYYISELIDKMAALDQCIDYRRGWVNDSLFYQNTSEDDAWQFNSRDGNYVGALSPEGDLNEASLSIELAPGSTTDESGRWIRRIDNPNIPECADVTLKVTMNSEMLTGAGAAISIRAFHAPVRTAGAVNEEYLYLTTTDDPVAGKLTNYVEELTIPCYSRKTTFIVLFLRLMAGTEGKVSFGNIQLVVEEK